MLGMGTTAAALADNRRMWGGGYEADLLKLLCNGSAEDRVEGDRQRGELHRDTTVGWRQARDEEDHGAAQRRKL